ncbi:MAG: asparagine--tRNA ligase [Defluviitaleaceae bacterium]|nr:asparagine--tRNA ligase [Defluviitaleaceae bacterium]
MYSIKSLNKDYKNFIKNEDGELQKVDYFDEPEDYKDGEEQGFTTITIEGWVRSLRDSKKIAFIDLYDGTTISGVQVVFEPEKFPEILKCSMGTALIVKGEVQESRGAGQKFEIKASKITIEGEVGEGYPLQAKEQTNEFLRTISHLRPRTNTYGAIFRMRSEASFAFHSHFREMNFLYVHSPIITSSDAEGAGEMFEITVDKNKKPEEDFFKRQAFLTVTGQFGAEVFAQSHKKTYTFGPTFRAENSNTSRHAAEFWMLEPEISFANLDDVINNIETMLMRVSSKIMDSSKEDIQFLNSIAEVDILDRLKMLAKGEFPRVTYTEAIELLQKANHKFEYEPKWGSDLQTEHERYLAETVYKSPVFVTNYPKEIKAFYMRLNDDGKTVAAVDLLVPGIGELVGGSQREERYDKLVKKMEEAKLDPKDYWWYLDLRKYGTTKHGGFGLGFERFLMYITGVTNIRDVLPFPRTVGSLEY